MSALEYLKSLAIHKQKTQERLVFGPFNRADSPTIKQAVQLMDSVENHIDGHQYDSAIKQVQKVEEMIQNHLNLFTKNEVVWLHKECILLKEDIRREQAQEE
jgi:hypothetical protein